MKSSYIYMCIDENTLNVKYIGKGVGARFKHILSGRSSSFKANKAFHNGDTSSCKVYKIRESVNHDFINGLEKALIYVLQPEWNIDHLDIEPDVDHFFLDMCNRVKTFIEWSKFEKEGVESSGMIMLFGALLLPSESFEATYKTFPHIRSKMRKLCLTLDSYYYDYCEVEDWSKVNW